MAETERSNLPIAEEPEFTTEIPAIRPDDPVHYAQMNAMLESLLGNDVFLQRLANKMIENSLIAHVLDCENPQMVLGADQAPVITGLIDGVKEDVTQLYSEILNIPEAYIDRDCVFTCNASGGTSKGTASETEYFSISSALKITIKRKFLLYISVYSNYAKSVGSGLWENIDAGESILINGITVTSSTKTSDILIPVNPGDVITFKCYNNSNTSTNDAALYMLPLFCTNRN